MQGVNNHACSARPLGYEPTWQANAARPYTVVEGVIAPSQRPRGSMRLRPATAALIYDHRCYANAKSGEQITQPRSSEKSAQQAPVGEERSNCGNERTCESPRRRSAHTPASPPVFAWDLKVASDFRFLR